ncbi:MAG: hypothetical protein K8T25_22010 [Planctomycetia bacterium]|nr:hypothetical protein [Planctomycetia bacterium]
MRIAGYRIAAALTRIWNEDEGFLTFEWVLLLTLLAIGVVGGLTVARDAIIEELGDVSDAVVHFDQSYSIAPFDLDCGGTTTPIHAPGFAYTDVLEPVNRCSRTGFKGNATPQQP